MPIPTFAMGRRRQEDPLRARPDHKHVPRSDSQRTSAPSSIATGLSRFAGICKFRGCVLLEHGLVARASAEMTVCAQADPSGDDAPKNVPVLAPTDERERSTDFSRRCDVADARADSRLRQVRLVISWIRSHVNNTLHMAELASSNHTYSHRHIKVATAVEPAEVTGDDVN